MKKKNGYIKRQVYMMSSIGLFYLIIIGFFAVPLLGASVVVLIRGVADYRNVILAAGALILIIILFALVQFSRKKFRKIRQDGFAANHEFKEKMNRGEPVQISIFKGLLTLTYGGQQQYANALPCHQENTALLPDMTEKQNQPLDLIVRLKELSELRNQGVITEDEFQTIKTRLIKGSDDSQE
ncbi:SHOCT domain-containing protein [Desulfobacterales bacterium HSG2]|nr:SHOCT domain-containing protein [Desulfobacterales bacterium HSG2]